MNIDTEQQKTIFVVLGMPRSGTSAIARGLKALGIDLGEKLSEADNTWNPKGFWEDADIVYKINRGVLFALNYPWMSVSLIKYEELHQESLHELKIAAALLIKERMGLTSCWGFKDPRTAKVLPFWQAVFTDLNLQDKYVIALRNPLATAYSYQRLSGEDIEVGLLLWLMHLIPAINATHSKKRILVSYDMMMQNPRLQLERMQTQLDLPHLSNQKEYDIYINEFLDKSLQHYEYSLHDLQTHPATAVSPICVKIYDLLLRVAKDECSLESDTFQSEWQSLMQEFDKVYSIYAYINKLLKKNKQLEKNMRSMRKSIPWRLIYPLRIIDDFLRSRRKKVREQNRLVKTYE